MNKTASIFYKTENAVVIAITVLALLNSVLIVTMGGGPMGWGVVVILLNIIIGSLGLPCWLWRNFLKNTPIDNSIISVSTVLINRCLLYFFVGIIFALNYDIPRTLKWAQNHRTQLKQEQFRNRFLCKYTRGEAPIENGIWVFNYQRRHRYGERFDEVLFEVHCKDGQLHGLAKEEHLNRGLWVENYYTKGFLDSNAVFRREFREEGRDTVIKIVINNFDYLNSKHLCTE